MSRNPLTLALLSAIYLTACGGGGSSVRSDPPAAQSPPAPTTCQDADARNFGGPLPCEPRYRGAIDNPTVPTNADRAHRRGITGAGVKVGIVGDSPNHRQDVAASFAGRSRVIGNFLPHGFEPSSRGHGDFVAAAIAGRPVDGFQGGGVAPDAELYWAIGCQANGQCAFNTPTVLAAFAAEGVRLINLSIGEGPYDPANPPQRFENVVSRTFADVLRTDMLLVWGNGNSGNAQPSLLAASPATYPEFAGNWLAVSGVEIDAQGQPTGLHPASNACGVAAEWCVTAPYVMGLTRDTFARGTSFSTGIVTGVAALVWDAYPWMSATNVQQTILTTARDLGDPGVDAVFGWGFVDADRATRGPAQFVRDFVADVTEGEFAFENPISGVGGLIKRGPGLLELTADNSYTGNTLIQGGTLALSGSVAGNVDNRATFRSVGGRIGGSYFAVGNSAVTEIQVGRGLTVAGTAQLDGTLRLLAPSESYSVQSRETVLTAGNVAGTFDSVVAGSGFFFSATLDYLPSSVIANLTRTSTKQAAQDAGAGEAAVAVGGWMDTLLAHLDQRALAGEDTNGALFANVARLTSAQTVEQAVSSLESLAGEVQGTVRAAGMEQTLIDATQIADRAEALRYVSGDGLSGWFAITGRSGDMENGGYADAEIRETGFMVGADIAVGAGSRLGVALSSSDGAGDLDALAGEFDADRTGAALYGRTGLGAGYLTGVLGYDRTKVDTDRSIDLGGVTERVRGGRTDRAWHGRIEAGYDVANWTPFVALGAIEQRMGGYAEQGAGGLGLAADEDAHTLSYADAGARYRFVTEGGDHVSGYLAGRFLISGKDAGYAASFAGAREATFVVDGQSLPSSVVRVGGQFVSRDLGGWRWFADAGLERSSEGLRNVSAGIGIRADF